MIRADPRILHRRPDAWRHTQSEVAAPDAGAWQHGCADDAATDAWQHRCADDAAPDAWQHGCADDTCADLFADDTCADLFADDTCADDNRADRQTHCTADRLSHYPGA